ncbi:MAG TPA: hypothetical protein VJR89_16050 [Polyangiales bacterium]|nr:hypothetical protein [Polyangiales bacterium]
MQRSLSWMVLVALLGAACGGDDSDGSMTTPQAGSGGGGGEECLPGTPEFVTGPAGLTAEDTAGGIKVRIDWADSQPPANDYNTWKVAVTDLAGMPLPQAQFTWACAWMPKHGHGTNPKVITRLSDGLFEIGKMNLSMNGGWDVRFWINKTGTGKDFAGGTLQRDPNACKAPDLSDQNIEFKICVPEKS